MRNHKLNKISPVRNVGIYVGVLMPGAHRPQHHQHLQAGAGKHSASGIIWMLNMGVVERRKSSAHMRAEGLAELWPEGAQHSQKLGVGTQGVGATRLYRYCVAGLGIPQVTGYQNQGMQGAVLRRMVETVWWWW